MVDAMDPSTDAVIDEPASGTTDLTVEETVTDSTEKTAEDAEKKPEDPASEDDYDLSDEDDVEDRPEEILKFADEMFQKQYGSYSDEVWQQLVKDDVAYQTALCEQRKKYYESQMAKQEELVRIALAKWEEIEREEKLAEEKAAEAILNGTAVQSEVPAEAPVSSDVPVVPETAVPTDAPVPMDTSAPSEPSTVEDVLNNIATSSTEPSPPTSDPPADSSEPQPSTSMEDDDDYVYVSRRWVYYKRKVNAIEAKLRVLKNGSKCIHNKKPKPKYIDCYDNANMPPFAKTFYPTAEEFSNPFDYVETIKKEGRYYGVIKIVPPKEFKPPFSLSRDLTFKPRTQRLCITDAFNKEHHMLRAKMLKFYAHDPAKCAVAKFGDVTLNLAIFFLSIDDHRVRYNGFDSPAKPCPARSRCSRYLNKVNEARWIAVANDCLIDPEYAPALEFYYYSVVSKFRAALRVEQILRMRYRKGLSHGLDEIYDTTEEPTVDGRRRKRAKPEDGEEPTVATGDAADPIVLDDDTETAGPQAEDESPKAPAESETANEKADETEIIVLEVEPEPKKRKLDEEAEPSSSEPLENGDRSGSKSPSMQSSAEPEAVGTNESDEVIVVKTIPLITIDGTPSPTPAPDAAVADAPTAASDGKPDDPKSVTDESKADNETSDNAPTRILPYISPRRIKRLLRVMKRKLAKDDYEAIMSLPEEEKMLFIARVLGVRIPKPRPSYRKKEEPELVPASDEEVVSESDDEVEDEGDDDVEEVEDAEQEEPEASEPEPTSSKPKRKEMMFSIYLNPNGETEMVEEEVEVDDVPGDDRPLEEQECTEIPFEIAEKLLPTRIKAVADEVAAHEEKEEEEEPEPMDTEVDAEDDEDAEIEPKGGEIDDNDNEIDTTVMDDDESPPPTPVPGEETPSEAAGAPNIRRSSRKATAAAVQKISTITGAVNRPTRGYVPRPRVKRFKDEGPIIEDANVVEMSKHLPYEGVREPEAVPIIKPVRRRGRPAAASATPAPESSVPATEETDEEPEPFEIDAEMRATYFKSTPRYSLQRFQDEMNQFKAEYFGVDNPKEVNVRDVERAFWKNVGDINSELFAFYGADLNSGNFGSGFPLRPKKKELFDAMTDEQKKYAMHPWNLNNMPIAPQSVFHHLEENISGMTIPWVYVGSCFSLFCWHVEDHWTYSINYMHEGDTKVWYGVPEACAAKFDSLMSRLAPEMSEEFPDLMHHMSTMVHPTVLMNHGIRTYTVHQNVGEIVITFPRAYHGGFNAGYNVAEAVNFAPYDWLAQGRVCLQNYAETSRGCVFAHDDLVLSMVRNADRLHPSMYIPICKELSAMFLRDNSFRNFLFQQEFDFTRPMVSLGETLYNEDVRSCVVCNTLLRGSAIMCKHMRISCPTHYKRICKRCPPESLHFASAQSPYILLRMLHKFATIHPVWEDIKAYLRIMTHKLKDVHKITTPEDLKTLLKSRRYFHTAKYPVLDVFVEFEKAWVDALPALRDFVKNFRSGNFPPKVGCGASPEASDAAHVSTEKESLAEKADAIDPPHTGEESQLVVSPPERELKERVPTAATAPTTYEDIAATTSENIQAQNSGSSNGVVRPSPYSLEDLYLAKGVQPPLSTSVSSGASTADVNVLSAHGAKDDHNAAATTAHTSTAAPKPMATLRTPSSSESPNDPLTYSGKVTMDRPVDNDADATMYYESPPDDYESPGAPLPPPSSSPQFDYPYLEPVPEEYDPPMAPLNRDVYEMKFGPYGFDKKEDEVRVMEHDSESGISTEPGSHENAVSTEQSIFSPTESSNSSVTSPAQAAESEPEPIPCSSTDPPPKRRYYDSDSGESSEDEHYYDDIFDVDDEPYNQQTAEDAEHVETAAIEVEVEEKTANPEPQKNMLTQARPSPQLSPSLLLKKASSMPAPEPEPFLVSMEVDTHDRTRSGSAHNVVIVITPPEEEQEAEQAPKAKPGRRSKGKRPAAKRRRSEPGSSKPETVRSKAKSSEAGPSCSTAAKRTTRSKETLTVDSVVRRRSPRFTQVEFRLPPPSPPRSRPSPREFFAKLDARRAKKNMPLITAGPQGKMYELPSREVLLQMKADLNYPKKRLSKSVFDKTLADLDMVGDPNDPANVYIRKNAKRSRWILHCYLIWQAVTTNAGDGLRQMVNRCEKKGLNFHTGRIFNIQIRDVKILAKEGKRYLNTADNAVRVFYEYLQKLHTWAIWSEQQSLRFLWATLKYGIGIDKCLAFENSVTTNFRWLSARYNNQLYKIFAKNPRIQYYYLQPLNAYKMAPQRSVKMRMYHGFRSSAYNDIKCLCDSIVAVHNMCTKFMPEFIPEDQYYRIYEMLLGRQDLVQLERDGSGHRLLLEKDTSSRKIIEFADICSQWEQIEGLMEESVEQLRTLFPLIVERNEDPNHELCSTCICGLLVTDVDPTTLNTVRCLICSCALHTACAQYTTFIEMVEKKHRRGFFACLRCVRSARPPLDDLSEYARSDMLTATTQSIEWYTLTKFFKTVLEVKSYFDALDIDALTNQQFRVEANIVLNQEVYDEATYNKILNHPAYDNYFTDVQTRRMEIVRRFTAIRRMYMYCQPLIFAAAGSRPRGNPKPKPSIMNRKNLYSEFDNLHCSAERCLRPFGKIQGYRCITKNCLNFYHNMCATWNDNEIDNLEKYQCKDCIAKGIERPDRPPDHLLPPKGRKRGAKGKKAPANPRPRPQRAIMKAKNRTPAPAVPSPLVTNSLTLSRYLPSTALAPSPAVPTPSAAATRSSRAIKKPPPAATGSSSAIKKPSPAAKKTIEKDSTVVPTSSAVSASSSPAINNPSPEPTSSSPTTTKPSAAAKKTDEKDSTADGETVNSDAQSK
uniref:SET domain-containing protein n=1 Tax=Panagrellus redivivus TaxID=6233 RepID=A0A7E4ZY19_PANRE